MVSTLSNARSAISWTTILPLPKAVAGLLVCVSSLVFLPFALGQSTAPTQGNLANADSSRLPGAGFSGQPKNVLVIFDEQDKLPGLAVLDQSLRSTFNAASSVTVDVYNESLDRSRFQQEDYFPLLSKYLREKYSGKKIDVIIAVMGPSLDFLLEHSAEISPGTPIVFCGVDRREIANRSLGPNVTGVLVKRDFKGTLDLALKLQPDTRNVVFISGTSNFDKRLAQQAMGELRAYEKSLAIEYLTDFEFNELLRKVSQLPPNTIILSSTVFSDNTGKAFVPHDVVSLLSQNANAPVYGFVDQYLGRGIVGGHLYSIGAHGNKAAELALRVMAGERIADLPVVEGEASSDMFDWRQLQKWGIDEKALPYGSIVEFKTPSVWDRYRVYVIAILAILFFQTMLIMWMMITRARRRKAELERNEFQALAKAEHARLDEVLTNVPGIVWESRVVDETGARRANFVSGYVEEMLGLTVEECLADPNFIISRIVEEDRETFKGAANLALLGDNQQVVQFRCVTKDGAWIWAESHMVAVRDNAGKAIGLRGVTMDITEGRKAKEKLNAKEKQLLEAQRLAQVGNWEWDASTEIVTWSEEIYRIYGLDPTKPAASFAEHSQLYKAESWAHLQSAVTNTLHTAEPYELELESIRGDGSHAWVSARGELVRDRRGLKLRGTLQDVTDRKKAEETIRESEARFRNLADTAPVMIWISDTEALCTFFNQFILDFTGLTMEQMVGEGWLEIIHEDDLANCIATYSAAYEGCKPFIMEFRVRRADGVYRWLYDTATPRFASNGEFLGYIGSAVDITDRKAAEEGLKTALDQIFELKNRLQEENIYLKEVIKLEHDFDEIVGGSDALTYVLFKIQQVAPTDATVLITGETGTGKELVARAIHKFSQRRDRPLVKVNCAALSASLIESELFGHERGAFTGAGSRKIGRFELADGATIFLDEVGELPLELQAKLLRLIQEGEFERLGSSQTLKADVRIMAATNRNLEAEVQAGRFRKDLLFRLNVFPLTVPPLRDRKDDIPVLVEYFTNFFARKLGKNITSVSPNTIRSLGQYHWPGNVRELANVIERAVIGTTGENLNVLEQLGDDKRFNGQNETADSLEAVERNHIIRTLLNTGWRIEGPNGAARVLRLHPSTLRTRMNKLGIVKSDANVNQHNPLRKSQAPPQGL